MGTIIQAMVLRITKRACVKKGFVDLKINDIMHNWRVCLTMGISKKKMKVSWCSPTIGVLKFNVDGAAQGKLGLAGIGGVLRNHQGKVLYMF